MCPNTWYVMGYVQTCRARLTLKACWDGIVVLGMARTKIESTESILHGTYACTYFSTSTVIRDSTLSFIFSIGTLYKSWIEWGQLMDIQEKAGALHNAPLDYTEMEAHTQFVWGRLEIAPSRSWEEDRLKMMPRHFQIIAKFKLLPLRVGA